MRRGVLGGTTAVAVKRINIAALMSRDASTEANLLREVEVMEQLDHPHCLKMHRWKREGDTLEMVLELCHGPELQAVLDSRGALGEPAARLITAQVASALAYLHSQAIVHRDLKPANLMLKANLGDGSATAMRNAPLDASSCVVKLLDFGLSRQLAPAGMRKPKRMERMQTKRRLKLEKSKSNLAADEPARAAAAAEADLSELTLVGTRGYSPPEIIGAAGAAGAGGKATLSDEQAFLIDAYALGGLLRYMLTGVPPTLSLMAALEMQSPLALLALCGCGPKLPPPAIVDPQTLSPLARELMAGLTQSDAAKRLSVGSALAHAWTTAAKSPNKTETPTGCAA